MTVEAHHSERPGGRRDRRNARWKSLWLVDDDISEATALEEIEDPLAALGFQPGGLPEFDRNAEIWQPFTQVFHEAVRRGRGQEPLGKLEHDRTELARVVQRLEALPKTVPDAFFVLGAEVLEIQVGLASGDFFP